MINHNGYILCGSMEDLDFAEVEAEKKLRREVDESRISYVHKIWYVYGTYLGRQRACVRLLYV